MISRRIFILSLLSALTIVATACSSSRGKGTKIDAPQYVDELYGSLNAAAARLTAVGAHVRYPSEIIVTFKVGSIRTRNGWGFAHSTGAVGGLTAGKHTTIALSPDGSYQPLISELELCHQLLGGTEESDYAWIRQAYPEWISSHGE